MTAPDEPPDRLGRDLRDFYRRDPLHVILAVLLASALGLSYFGYFDPLKSLFVATVASLIALMLASLHATHESETSTDLSFPPRKTVRVNIMSSAQLVAAMPDPALLLDSSVTIQHHNTAAESLFGKSLDGRALEHVSRDPELITAVEDALLHGERRIARIAWRGDVERHLMATIAPLGAKSGRAADQVLITIRDLSEQHRVLEMRSDFIANASHELRTPLASVRGFIETLQGPARYDETARDRFLTIMAAQAERMTRLIDDLLLLSRVEEKAYLAPTGKVDLDDVIADVVRTLLPIADERKISISPPRANRSTLVVGERDELFQVFQNLIENAVKYGRDGGTVTVTRTQPAPPPGQPSRVTITITDDGPGIAPEHLPRLTERFYRVNADQSRKIGGTGLGLAIVKHVINRHKGELQIESQLGLGTTVRVTLPATT